MRNNSRLNYLVVFAFCKIRIYENIKALVIKKKETNLMANGILKIDLVQKKKNTITTRFAYSGRWNDFLGVDEIVNTYDEDIESVPDSIAIIPALCNLLPLAWVYDLSIEIPEADSTFMDSLPKILKGYKNMYPDLRFSGSISARHIVNNRTRSTRSGVLFSGGVDATTTAYRHLDESPDIITVFGSDISLSDTSGIANVNNSNKRFAKLHKLQYESIYSTFRSFLKNEGRYFKDTPELKSRSYGWWHEFQHGIGLIGLVAPLAFVRGYKTVYIASSYHSSQKGKYTCASDPTIDNKLSYGNVNTFHDGYELTRQDKVRFICNFAKEHNLKPYLRVCWESSGGKNCCHCEKCRRTYLAIMAEKFDPSDFGLPMNQTMYKRMIKWFIRHLPYKYDMNTYLLYKPIQDAFVKNWSENETPKRLRWFRTLDLCKKQMPLRVKIINHVRKKLGIE